MTSEHTSFTLEAMGVKPHAPGILPPVPSQEVLPLTPPYEQPPYNTVRVSPTSEVQTPMPPAHEEVERLLAFDQALQTNDGETIKNILGQAKEVSIDTGSSEYWYLNSRRAAHHEGVPHDVLLRREAIDRAAEAGDDNRINSVLDEEAQIAQETGSTQAYEAQLENLAANRRTHAPTDEERNRDQLKVLADPRKLKSQSYILDDAYSKAKEKGDFSRYNELLSTYFAARPGGAEGR